MWARDIVVMIANYKKIVMMLASYNCISICKAYVRN